MSIIYQPMGKAREYSPLAANFYNGCDHGCKYCYAPSIRRMNRKDYLNPEPRRNIIKEFEKDAKNNYKSENQVLFCFMTDPYNNKEMEYRITYECLKIALKYKIPVSILTKNKTVLNDLELFKKFKKNIKIGFTLTFDNDKDSIEWEPGASCPNDRIETLKILKENNIQTWASFEPVIIVEQSLRMIERTLDYVDVYKIGKLNNYNGIDKNIDWTEFLQQAVDILRVNNKPFYIKKDLREAANKIKLYGNEVLQDEFNLCWK